MEFDNIKSHRFLIVSVCFCMLSRKTSAVLGIDLKPPVSPVRLQAELEAWLILLMFAQGTGHPFAVN